MTHHDLLVVGGGTGNNLAAAGAEAGLDTALVEKGNLGGTCLNRGCNPSKMLIQAASAVEGVREAGAFHVDAEFSGVDVAAVVDEMDETLSGLAAGMEESYRETDNLTLYSDEATSSVEKCGSSTSSRADLDSSGAERSSVSSDMVLRGGPRGGITASHTDVTGSPATGLPLRE